MNVYVLFLFDSYKQSRSSCSVLRWGNVSCVYSTDHALSIQRLPLSNTFHIWSVELTCWNPARMNIFTGRCLPGRNQIHTHDSKRLRCQAYARRSAIISCNVYATTHQFFCIIFGVIWGRDVPAVQHTWSMLECQCPALWRRTLVSVVHCCRKSLPCLLQSLLSGQFYLKNEK